MIKIFIPASSQMYRNSLERNSVLNNVLSKNGILNSYHYHYLFVSPHIMLSENWLQKKQTPDKTFYTNRNILLVCEKEFCYLRLFLQHSIQHKEFVLLTF